ncbi:MAG: MarR family transcriptional regulator [Candidatus Bipolaricaulis sp.]|nr:MarR family transcriptional regulator [Candidatus Bipolaricaulis sp.]MDD5646808.1 MarR family transcriptional regulator [Candidatus Bipolaricaulis sp.]
MRDRRQGGFLLSKAHRLAGRVFSRLLRERGIEINSAQGRVLFALWRQDRIPITELARRTALGKSALTSMLDRLEGQGYVERVPDSKDRRTTRIARTDKDRAMEAAYRRVSDEMSRIFYAGFSAAEIARFEKDLARILANLEGRE